MRGKIDLVEFIYYIITAFIVGFFLVFSIGIDTSRNIAGLLSIGVLVLFIPALIVNFGKFPKSPYIYSSFLLVSILYEIIRSYRLYALNFQQIFLALRQYIWIFLFWILLFQFKRARGNYQRILNNILIIVVITLLIRSIPWFLYTFFQIETFPKILKEFGGLWYRNATAIRVDGTPLISIALFLSIYLSMKFQNLKYRYATFIIMSYILFVNQTRVLIFSVVISGFLMYLYSRESTFLLRFSKIIIVFGILGCIIFGGISLLSNQYTEMLSIQDRGLGYRYWELNYYLSLLAENNWKYGVGILTGSNPNSAAILYGTWTSKMYLDDLGFLELFVQFGMLSILLYGYLFYKLQSIIRKLDYKAARYEKALMVAIFSNLLITMISLNVYGIQRSFSLSIILALIFYFEDQLRFDMKGVS